MWRLSCAGALVVMHFEPTDRFGRAEEERNRSDRVATTSFAENPKRHPGKSSDAADKKKTKRWVQAHL